MNALLYGIAGFRSIRQQARARRGELGRSGDGTAVGRERLLREEVA